MTATSANNAPLPASPTITLSDNTKMPQLGYGTYKIAPEDARDAVLEALRVGYRHIDTAQMYGNEEGVGQALRDSGLPRDDVYVTTKLNNTNHKPADVDRSMDKSLELLGIDQVDLFLVHWPLTTVPDLDLVETWRAMEEINASGRARTIGVSNYQPYHLQELADAGCSRPVVNQVELHPWFTNNAICKYADLWGITIQAWSPLGRGVVLDDPVIVDIAQRLGATPAQVVIRWHMDEGRVVIPKSVTPERIRSNFDVSGITLTRDDVAAIRSLNRGEEGRQGSHPDTMNRM